ncbi:MAG: uridine monophosphate kinase [Lachnospirales bacterium]
MFKRVLIKLSGEALAGNKNFGFCEETVNSIVDDIIEASKNTEINLVVGGGNFWRGRSKSSGFDRSSADQIGMLGTAMNGIYLAEILRQKGKTVKVYSPLALANITKQFTKASAEKNLKNGGINIFVCGVGHPFFSTDTIAALRAAELECDCILFAKNIDGIYDCDPNKNKNAVKYKEITYRQIIKDDLQAIDISAINICETESIKSLVFALNAEKSIVLACENNDKIYEIGTLIN